MKLCPNPDCLSHQQHRAFYDTDVVCPRCGEVLVNPNLAGTGTVPPDTYPAYAATAPTPVLVARPALSSELALLGAAGTLLLAFLIVAVMIALGVIHRGGTLPGATGGVAPTFAAPPGTVSAQNTPAALLTPLTAAQTTATARAVATFLAQATPIGGLAASPTPAGGFNTQGLPTLPPPLGVGNGSGTGGGGLPAPTISSNSSAITPRLCRQLSAGQLCTEATGYGTRDTFYIAVQAIFGPSAAQSLRVRLYGPPNGETQLLGQDQTNTPGRNGQFWVGFAFSQNQPWQPGIYRADIFVNNDPNRVAFITWSVQ